MSKYPPADSQVQWFQDNFPGATMNLTADNTVFCIHTTEGTSWPTYLGGAQAPTYTAMPRIAHKALDWRQHFPDEKSARALQNLPGGVETNTLNCVQVELIGTCDPAHKLTWNGLHAGHDYIFWPDAPDWLLGELAKFVAYLHTEHGLKLVAPKFNPYPASISANRFTGAAWSKFAGICGHQHVPENVHGDPGNLDVPKLIALTKAIVTPAPAPSGPTKSKRKIEHPRPGHPEYEGDSNRAIDHAAANGIEWWDGNVLVDKHGTPLNAHYDRPLDHGFIDPKKLLDKGSRLSEMEPEEWGRLETVKGTPPYVVRPMAQRIDHAVKKGVNTEADLKCMLSVAACKTLLRGSKVQFKTMANLNEPSDPRVGTPWERCRKAKKAGGVTILICPRPFMKVPKEYKSDIDHYRRFKPRFV